MPKSQQRNIINGIKAGDHEAFKLLIAQYEKLIWAMIHDTEVGKSNDAEDVFQEVCVAIWLNISKIKQRLDSRDWDATVKLLIRWIRRVVRNKCADYLRSKQRQGGPHPGEEIQQLIDEDSLTEANLGELDAKLADGMAELAPIYREVIELHEIQGWKISEIAKMIGVPEGTVKWRLHEARKQLRKYCS